jgi:hypothetical protein
MDISLFGYKMNLEVLILIGVIYLILVGHTFCGCCNMHGLLEGLTDMAKGKQRMDNQDAKNAKVTHNKTKMLPTQVTAGSKEGFVGANTNYGESSFYNLSQDSPVNTSSWSMSDLTVVPGQPLSPGVKSFLAREPQPVPLPEGELLLFANTPFKPECCPNTYSTSTGCACMTGDQYNYLKTRSFNNVPYSEY